LEPRRDLGERHDCAIRDGCDLGGLHEHTAQRLVKPLRACNALLFTTLQGTVPYCLP
jgi:hypothetical protein